MASLRAFEIDRPAAIGSAAAACARMAVAGAEKSDRSKPLNVEADSGRYDDLKQVGTSPATWSTTKASMTMRGADRGAPGPGRLPLHGGAGPGQLRDLQPEARGDETIQGEAERIEYDGRNDTVKFVNRTVIRRYQGTTLTDETAGRTRSSTTTPRGLQRRRRDFGGDAGQPVHAWLPRRSRRATQPPRLRRPPGLRPPLRPSVSLAALPPPPENAVDRGRRAGRGPGRLEATGLKKSYGLRHRETRRRRTSRCRWRWSVCSAPTAPARRRAST